MRAEIAKSAQR